MVSRRSLDRPLPRFRGAQCESRRLEDRIAVESAAPDGLPRDEVGVALPERQRRAVPIVCLLRRRPPIDTREATVRRSLAMGRGGLRPRSMRGQRRRSGAVD